MSCNCKYSYQCNCKNKAKKAAVGEMKVAGVGINRLIYAAEVVVKEVTSGVYKVVKDRVGSLNSYINSNELVNLLNSDYVVLVITENDIEMNN